MAVRYNFRYKERIKIAEAASPVFGILIGSLVYSLQCRGYLYLKRCQNIVIFFC